MFVDCVVSGWLIKLFVLKAIGAEGPPPTESNSCELCCVVQSSRFVNQYGLVNKGDLQKLLRQIALQVL